MTTPQDDPFDTAFNPTAREYFGQFDTDMWFCILQKGVGKAPFDPQQHTLDQRRVAITITLNPLPEMKMDRPIVRDSLDTEIEWYKHTLVSAKALGVQGKALAGKWGKAILVNTRTVITNSGSPFDKTAWKFLDFYADEAACRAAYLAAHPTRQGNTESTTSTSGSDGDTQQASGNVYPAFLRALVKRVLNSVTTDGPTPDELIAAELAKDTVLSKLYTAESPEVTAILTELQQSEEIPF